MRLFCPSAPSSTRVHVAWTLAQSAVLWALALGVGPWVIVRVEQALGLVPAVAPGQRAAAAALFLTASGLNLASGVAMARHGDGTPLPTMCARRLVVRGPYRWLRNPMAVFGLSQGLAVALWLGSPGTVAYVVAGGVVWHALVRPLEEADLERRFGDAYGAYRRHVRCWVPRLSPYAPAG